MAEAGLPADIASMSFEVALAELETIVKRLETGNAKLDYKSFCTATCNDWSQAEFNTQQVAAYAAGKAVNRASVFGIDDVIDPAETRRWILAGLKSLPPTPPRTGKKLRWIDAW